MNERVVVSEIYLNKVKKQTKKQQRKTKQKIQNNSFKANETDVPEK